jgi:hypothetical protein
MPMRLLVSFAESFLYARTSLLLFGKKGQRRVIPGFATWPSSKLPAMSVCLGRKFVGLSALKEKR